MKENNKFGFTSQGYEAPRAESVMVAQQSVLCASPVNGNLESFEYEDSYGSWDEP